MIVLDSSAMIALLFDEPGADIVAAAGEPVISTVNLAEVFQKSEESALDADYIGAMVKRMEIGTIAFTEDHATRAARLRAPTRHLGLSLGDRACLALAQARDCPALTADRAWARLAIGVEIRLIR